MKYLPSRLLSIPLLLRGCLMMTPVFAAAAEAGNAPGEIVLLENGKSVYQVVVPDSARTPDLEALLRETGELLQNAFAAAGAKIPLVKESKKDPAKPGIFLGETAFARGQGAGIESLDGWSYVMRVAGKDLILAGQDAPNPGQLAGVKTKWGRPIVGTRLPTLKAVADFLHEFAGTRFLYPDGEVGMEFSAAPRIALPPTLKRTVRPQMRFNFDPNLVRTGVTSVSRGRDLWLVANNYLPSTELVYVVHSYPRAIPAETYSKTHPEYFALVGGKRMAEKDIPDNQMEHYCISNPEVQELIYQDLVHWLDFGYDSVCLGQQDGFIACQCEECKKLYETGEDWSEKLWIFHHRLAERLRTDRPGKKVLLLSYGLTWSPPKTFKSFPENATVLLCRMTPEVLEQWAKCDVPGGYTGYVYIWGAYNYTGYSLSTTPLQTAKLAKKFHTLGLQGLILDGFGRMFGMEGPSYYVFGRMFDDPENLEVGKLLDEYYNAAFGEAAAPMRKFFDTLFHAIQIIPDWPGSYEDASGKRRFFVDRNPMKLLAFIYSPDVLAQLQKELSDAESAAKSAKVKSRIALIRLEFDYTQHIARVAHLWNAWRVAPDSASLERLLDAVDAWNKFLGPHWFPWDRERNAWGAGQLGGQVSGWLEHFPLLGESRHAVALTRNNNGATYADTPLNWDTAAIRSGAILPPGAPVQKPNQAPAEDYGAVKKAK